MGRTDGGENPSVVGADVAGLPFEALAWNPTHVSRGGGHVVEIVEVVLDCFTDAHAFYSNHARQAWQGCHPMPGNLLHGRCTLSHSPTALKLDALIAVLTAGALAGLLLGLAVVLAGVVVGT